MSEDQAAAAQIDAIISNTEGWRGGMLAKLRAVVAAADPGIVEEVKWKKPSKPQGIPVWTYNGKNICMADTLKNAVRLTFPKGAAIKDPHGLFNTRLDSKSVRAIDFYEGTAIDIEALRSIIIESVGLSY